MHVLIKYDIVDILSKLFVSMFLVIFMQDRMHPSRRERSGISVVQHRSMYLNIQRFVTGQKTDLHGQITMHGYGSN